MALLMIVGDASGKMASMVEPWSKLYSHSKGVSAAVLFLHLVPLILAAGPAIVMDRATLRASRSGADERARQLAEQHGTHRMIVAGLALSAISGALLFFSDVETFWTSVYFWVKITCVVLLLLNGYLITRTEQKLLRGGDTEGRWARMRLHAHLSIVLWLGTALAGVILQAFA